MCLYQTIADGTHSLDGIHLGNEFADNPHAVQCGLILQQLVATCRRKYQVDSWEHAFVGKHTVELQFGVTCTLEFLEDYFVHLRTSVCQCGSNDGQRTAAFDVTGCTEETLGLLQGICVDTTCEYLTAGGSNGIVGACQTCDGVEEDDDVVTAFYHSLGLFQYGQQARRMSKQ